MANNLFLNQSYTQSGLGTVTFTVPQTVQGTSGLVSVSNTIFSCYFNATLPSAVAPDNGAGTGRDLGLGVSGGFGGAGANAKLGLGNGATGLGFGGSAMDNAAAQVTYPAVYSSLSVVVNQNGSPVYTAPAVSATQGQLAFKIPLLCNAGDSITIVLSSSNVNDEMMNAINANLGIELGN